MCHGVSWCVYLGRLTLQSSGCGKYKAVTNESESDSEHVDSRSCEICTANTCGYLAQASVVTRASD